jgi:hypothetical protein
MRLPYSSRSAVKCSPESFNPEPSATAACRVPWPRKAGAAVLAFFHGLNLPALSGHASPVLFTLRVRCSPESFNPEPSAAFLPSLDLDALAVDPVEDRLQLRLVFGRKPANRRKSPACCGATLANDPPTPHTTDFTRAGRNARFWTTLWEPRQNKLSEMTQLFLTRRLTRERSGSWDGIDRGHGAGTKRAASRERALRGRCQRGVCGSKFWRTDGCCRWLESRL